ncbi:alpha/beta hydrolase [Asticcacaulis sp. EMRT-3]|uniref:alpha/beta hydrolase n=1 Tax=Asticcacaulis sp. EMRT-3 TaxID=3040349 RepID=UPI0024AFF00C|nr:alpha/beta hydrolase [Asticcacaulis sp. EMRT-3]MDI7773829.1 alpha/beta hydrolase [Asticcacaulis sp. EMRT-3]
MSRIAALSTSAPLMFTPESRMPEGGVGEWFRGAGGLRLRLGYWPAPRAERASRGTVFVSPGRSEPIEKYYEVVRDLLARDFDVVVHDWRGQGLSARLLPDRLKCHARSADEFLDDYQRLLDTFEERAPKPWIMLGHSMGAALNLATLVKGEPRISAAFLVNPMLRVKTGNHSLWAVNFQVNWQVNHGRGSDYVPDLFEDPFENTFENDALTHDRARYERWREQLFACPHLAVGSPTWGWLQFALRIGEKLLRDKDKALKKVGTPITLLCSGDDHVVNRQPVRAFARKLGKAHYAEVAGAEHEILIEADEYRDQAWQAFDALMDSVASADGVAESMDAPDADEAAFAAWPQAEARLAAAAMPLPDEVLPETTPVSGDQA